MILWLVATAIVVAGVALLFYARTFTQRVEAEFPPTGRFISANGARIHLREAGPADAPRILLIHGASSNLRELWGPLAEEFTPLHRVIAYDRPGLGHSTRGDRKAHTLASQARTAALVITEVGGPVIVVGHSLGAAVSLRLALDYPELVRGLVLIAPAGVPHLRARAWWARLAATPILGDAFCHLVVPLVAPMAAGASIANNFWPAPAPVSYRKEAGVPLVFRPRAFRANAQDVCATYDEFSAQAPRYSELLTPTIILTAEKERIVSPKRHARVLAATLPAAELVIAPDTGHMPHRLRTDLVIAAIRRVNEMAAPPAQD